MSSLRRSASRRVPASAAPSRKDESVAEVAGVWRYPVKSAHGERLQRVQVTPRGVVGDRLWAVVDEDGTVVSAKHPARGGRLLQVACRFSEASGETFLQVPGESEVVAGTAEADTAVSSWLGRPVHLTKEPARDAALRRWWPTQPGLVPEWEVRAVAGSDAITSMAGPVLRQSFVDYGAIHVIFTDDLRRLAATTGDQVDPVRFRPNVMVDAGGEFRDAARLRVGELTLHVELPTPRCAVPGLSPENGSLDPAILRALARHDRRAVGSRGTATCFGLYAASETDGALNVGDGVSLL